MGSTADALRLSRLDRLINQLGEHHLSIRQQGTSVSDLDDRLRGVEKKVEDDMQALYPLRELDVHGELMAARASIDKLAKQVAMLSRDQEEGRIQSEKRLQQVEARQADTERQLTALAAAADAAAADAAAAVEELRQGTKSMLTEVISRIADQFDALQAALEEAIGGRQQEGEERAAAAAAVQQATQAQRVWVEQRAEQLQQRVEEALEGAAGKAAAAVEQQQQGLRERLAAVEQQAAAGSAGWRQGLEAAQLQSAKALEQQAAQARALEQQAQALAAVQEAQALAAAGLEAAQQQLAAAQVSHEANQQAAAAGAEAIDALRQQVAGVAAEQAAAGARQAEGEDLLRQAFTVWQRGLEEQLVGLGTRLEGHASVAAAAQEQLTARFEEYKGYVKRLRRQVAESRAEQETSSMHIAAVRQSFDVAHNKMEQVNAEAAALGGALMETTAAAAATGATLRQLRVL